MQGTNYGIVRDRAYYNSTQGREDHVSGMKTETGSRMVLY